MKQMTWGVALLLVLLLVGACSSAEGQSELPTITTPTATPAAAVPTLATSAAISQTNPTGDADVAGLPAALAVRLSTANATHGSELAQQLGCTACHALEAGVTLVGPSWYQIGAVAATRVPGESAALYLYHSIIDPNQHVVEGFLPNLMPQTYGEQLSEQDLADLMQYLLTLQ